MYYELTAANTTSMKTVVSFHFTLPSSEQVDLKKHELRLFACSKGDLVELIKYARELKGLGLKDAKDLVDACRDRGADLLAMAAR